MGQADKLAPWIKSDFEESDLNSIVFGLETLVKAKYHFAEKRYPAALAVLETWGTRSSLWDFVLGRIEKKALEAVCYYQLRDKEAAYTALNEAYKLAHPNALYMPFMELGKNMRALTDAVLKDKDLTAGAVPRGWLETIRQGAANYAKRLFTVTEQFRATAQKQKKPGMAAAGLSARELQVLTELSRGMTREEIAGLASLSVNTVKSVIRSIYNKLGAVNRVNAVQIAADMGLLGTKNDV